MLFEEVKKLELENSKLKTDLEAVSLAKKALEELVEKYKDLCKSVIPNHVYTHKARKNTIVKFLDGSQQTVTRRAGEKDCIETAIAYCILKQLMPAKDLKKLIETKEEH